MEESRLSDERPTHLDLYSGTLAAQWAGFKTVGFCEIEPYPSAVLEHRFPSVRNYGDVRNVKARANLVTAGFPCPPFSVAGKRRGKDDDRYLWPETCAALQRSEADWFLGENVTGIVNMALDNVLADLEAVGYAAQPFIIPAVAVDGAFFGDRVWIVAASSRARLSPGREIPVCSEQVQSVLAGGGVHRRVALPAERQYEWEEPRLVERPMARATDGVPAELVRFASAESIRAMGNSIVPQVAYQIIAQIARQLANERHG